MYQPILLLDVLLLCFPAITNNAASVAMIPMYYFSAYTATGSVGDNLPRHTECAQSVHDTQMPFGKHSRTIDVDDTRLELDVCIALFSE